jgi:hypothetical protein
VNTFTAEVADFVDCVASGRHPINTEVEGVQVLEVILGAYRSADEKRIVSLGLTCGFRKSVAEAGSSGDDGHMSPGSSADVTVDP